MAKVQIDITKEWRLDKIAKQAGAKEGEVFFENGYLVCPNIPQELLEQALAVYDHAKETAPSQLEIREASLSQLIYDFGDGRVIQTRPKDEQNIRNAIELMTNHNIQTTAWVMADDVKHLVTVADLQAALSYGQMAAKAIWDNYIPTPLED